MIEKESRNFQSLKDLSDLRNIQGDPYLMEFILYQYESVLKAFQRWRLPSTYHIWLTTAQKGSCSF